MPIQLLAESTVDWQQGCGELRGAAAGRATVVTQTRNAKASQGSVRAFDVCLLLCLLLLLVV